MAIHLDKRADQDTFLSDVQVDNNWGKIQEAINALQAANPSASKSMVTTLGTGDNSVAHNMGKKARSITFFQENLQPTNYLWKRDPDDELNKIIITVPVETPAREYTNLEINIQAK